MGALNGVWLPFYTWLLYGPHGHSPPCQPLTWGQDVHARPHAPQQVTKVHEPPREDTVPPKPVPPVPPPTQHLQPEGDVSQQSGGSPRGKSRSPVPPAEKEGECWAQGCSGSERQPSSLLGFLGNMGQAGRIHCYGSR